MGVSGVVLRASQCGIDSAVNSSRYSPSSSSSSSYAKPPACRVNLVRSKKFFPDSIGFYDNGHLDYYSSSKCSSTGRMTISCGGKKKVKDHKMVQVKKEKEVMKKRLKLLKALSRELSDFSDMRFGLDPDNHGLVDQVKVNMISEAADILLGQLQRLKAEEKELKRKKKEEKAGLRAARSKNKLDCGMSSSSSSSESSDSECGGEVVDINSLKSGSLLKHSMPTLTERVAEKESHDCPPCISQKEKGATVLGTLVSDAVPFPHQQRLPIQEENPISGEVVVCSSVQEFSSLYGDVASGTLGEGKSLVAGVSPKRIEVCMGSKCRKSGAAALLEEFQRAVGVEGAVCGCKCMGKCRDGPNVRVLKSSDGCEAAGMPELAGTCNKSLCIGVGLEDVNLIVAKFLVGEQRGIGLAGAATTC